MMEQKQYELAAQVLREVQKVILGKREIVEKVLMAVLAQGHVLLDDVPGVGKTTLASLIPRFYDATAGTVLVDGLDVREYTFDALYNKLGYVTQKAVLFSARLKTMSFSGRAQQKRRTRRCKPRFPCRRQRNSWTNTPKRPHIPSPSLAGTSPAGRSSGFPSRVRWQERRKF